MPMTHAEMDHRIDEHFGFEARDDVEGVLATLAPDVEHDIVGWPTGPTRGREGARPSTRRCSPTSPTAGSNASRRLYGDDFLVDESLWRGGRPAGRSASRAATGRSSSGCCTSSSSPTTARSGARTSGSTWRRDPAQLPQD